ncbi:MAG: hypothetical protein FWC27_13380 [Firmicutes bacterium]|nr:hypothetical protein [Bacillota bacterium]
MPPIKKRTLSFVLTLSLLAAMISGMAVRAGAAETTQLPAGMLIGDQDGIHADAHGVYYIDARGLMPGDVIHKVITIQNLSQNDTAAEAKIPYTVSMMTEPLLTRGPVDLLDKVRLTIKLEGQVIYDGRSRGDGPPDMTVTPLQLGTYELGARKILDVTLTVAPDMEVHEEKSEADFKWIFYAFRALKPEPPKTGLLENYGYLMPVGVVLLLVFLFLKKRRDRDRQTAEQPLA